LFVCLFVCLFVVALHEPSFLQLCPGVVLAEREHGRELVLIEELESTVGLWDGNFESGVECVRKVHGGVLCSLFFLRLLAELLGEGQDAVFTFSGVELPEIRDGECKRNVAQQVVRCRALDRQLPRLRGHHLCVVYRKDWGSWR